jgi:hypothetical protein
VLIKLYKISYLIYVPGRVNARGLAFEDDMPIGLEESFISILKGFHYNRWHRRRWCGSATLRTMSTQDADCSNGVGQCIRALGLEARIEANLNSPGNAVYKGGNLLPVVLLGYNMEAKSDVD